MITGRHLKRILALALYATGITRLVFFWQFKIRKKILVLLYHEIRPPRNRFEAAVSPDNFERQIRFVRRHFEIIPVSRMMEFMVGRVKIRKPVAVITFDDGYKDNFTTAYPILKKLGAPAIIFTTVGSVGNKNRMWTSVVEDLFGRTPKKEVELSSLPSGRVFEWPDEGEEKLRACHEIKAEMKKVPDTVRQAILDELRAKLEVQEDSCGSGEEMLSWDDIRELGKGPLIEIGSHSLTHRMLAKLPSAEMIYELRESGKKLREEAGIEVRYVSYPGNSYNAEVQKCAADAGYQAGFAVDRRLNGLNENRFGLRRVHIEDDPMYVFQAEISLLVPFIYSVCGK